MVTKTILQKEIKSLTPLFSNPTASSTIEEDKWVVASRSGYEVFYFQRPSSSFIWEGRLTVEGLGKLGLVSDIDNDGNGYFISFDILRGSVSIRAWGYNPANNKQNFIFNDIQSNVFTPNEKSLYFKFIRYGSYIELSIDDKVKLTLMDYTYCSNSIGLYSSSSSISLQDSILKVLPDPEEEYASQEETQKILQLKQLLNE